MLLVALDVEKTHEMTAKEEVLKALLENNLSGNLLKFKNNFLSNRKIRVRINDSLSEPRVLENGLLQGSVFSTLLLSV